MENLLAGKMENLGLFSRTPYCPIPGHEKETLKMFCSTKSCMKAVCVICALSTHKNHIISDLDKVVYEKRNNIEKTKGSVQLIEKQAQASLTMLKQMDERNSSESMKNQEEVIACFNEAKKVLDQRAMQICNAVRAKQSEKEIKFDLEKKRLNKIVDATLQICHYLNIAPYMNNQSFLNASKAIEMRLQELESQTLGGQLSVDFDTLKFIPKELDFSFKETAKGFGKLMVTKVCSFKSKAIVKPARYVTGKEITFQITLLSSVGNIIDDEDVKVSLKHRGQNLTLIQCSFEKSSRTYKGNWVSHVPTEISWNVLSNDIELETLKGDLQVKRYSRFFTDDKPHPTSTTDDINGTKELRKAERKTPEGLEIKIYKESILRVHVDCIVNSANEQLMHGGGVAAAISEAAGYAFDDESKNYIAMYGPIAVGRCAVTSAGKLPYKYVIHTVGPRWSDYLDKDCCLEDLCESVEVTFREADKLGMKSIALPAISSGIFGVPRNKCVEQYYKAVMTFSRSYPFRSLKEIHFVDRDTSMVSAIQAVLQQIILHDPQRHLALKNQYN